MSYFRDSVMSSSASWASAARDRLPSSISLLHRGVTLYHEGELRESARLLHACAATAEHEGDHDTELLARSNLAEAYTLAGRLEDAERVAVKLLQRSREEQLRAYEVRAVGRLALAVLQRDARGQWNDLRMQLTRSVELARRLRLDYWVVQNLETLGAYGLTMGSADEALSWLQQALHSAGKDDVNESEFFRARVYARLAELYATRKLVGRSAEYLALAAEYATDARSPHLTAQMGIANARCALAGADADKALHEAHPAHAAARRGGWLVEEHASVRVLAAAYRECKQHHDAVSHARRALELSREMRMPEAEVDALCELGRILRCQGELADARGHFHDALAVSRARSYSDHVVTATLELARTR
jgi:tetratricopeptide (TPR) repeat protein